MASCTYRGSWGRQERVLARGTFHRQFSKKLSVKHKTAYFQLKLSLQNSQTILIPLLLGVFTVLLQSITPRILPVPWLCQFPYYFSQTPGRVHRHCSRENIMMPCNEIRLLLSIRRPRSDAMAKTRESAECMKSMRYGQVKESL